MKRGYRQNELLVDEGTAVLSDSQWPLTDKQHFPVPLELLLHLHHRHVIWKRPFSLPQHNNNKRICIV